MSNVEMAARVHLSQVRAFDMIRRLVHRETLPVTAAPILKSELSIQRSHHGRKSVPNLLAGIQQSARRPAKSASDVAVRPYSVLRMPG